MKRQIGDLSGRIFDLVVVGGGIYGVCVAWEATLRGLSVALVEQGDFGHATSANSQKIVHGGFRYLQHADLRRMRESITERKVLMRIAPHLVQLLPVLLPTYARGLQQRAIMRAALAVYDLVAFDRNQGVRDEGQRIPAGRLVSRQECLRLAPGIAPDGVTGGAIWHDGQIYNPDRLTLAFVRSAVEQGARAANYLRVTDLLLQERRVVGVRAEDRLGGRTLEIRGRWVVNTVGPWIRQWAERWHGMQGRWRVPLVKTVNIITPPLTDGHAVSLLLPHGAGGRRLFITPWRGQTIIGSFHRFFEGPAEACRVDESEVEALLADVNTVYPGAHLTPANVSFVHVGLLPCEEAPPHGDPAHLLRRYQIHDHHRDGFERLLSVVGVKYTTARDVAVKTVHRVIQRLGVEAAPSRSDETPVHGGAIERPAAFQDEVLRQRPCDLSDDVLRQMIGTYGSEYRQVLRYLSMNRAWGDRVAPNTAVLKAQVVYAVREEMAQTVADVVLRRTELGTLGHPGMTALGTCAELMAAELGWDAVRTAREVEAAEEALARCGARPIAAAV